MNLVSIICAVYNKEAYLSDTIKSVLNQTYKNWELILVDDNSNEVTKKILKIQTDERIKIFTNTENRGANYCRNYGLKNAKGEFVIFLDADDILKSNCIENRINTIAKNNAFDFYVFTSGVFTKQIGDNSFLWLPTSKNPLKDLLSHSIPWLIMQPIWKVETLRIINGFDESFKRMQDVDLHTRALLIPAVNYTLITSEPDCYYRIDEDRKNFNPATFLLRWVESSILYYNKFKKLLPKEQIKYLKGTIYQTNFELISNLKQKQISSEVFFTLHQKLFSETLNKIHPISKLLFSISKYYNLYFFRVPGFNRALKFLIML